MLRMVRVNSNADICVNKWGVSRVSDQSVQQVAVRNIVNSVRQGGDKALFAALLQFEKQTFTSSSLVVSATEYQQARKVVSSSVKATLTRMKKNISFYQNKLKPKNSMSCKRGGAVLGQRWRPLSRVGVYVPGGTAPLVSTVLMTALPAHLAGVKEIYVATPAGADGKVNPAVLAACELCGVSKVFKMGGAQAIAALAYGTETVPAVDKIVGPGNSYVTLAKKEVFGQVDIDMLAGPSEILVIADAAVPASWVAADLMSQAEHDAEAASYLICFDEAYARQVEEAWATLVKNMPRKKTIEASGSKNGIIFVVKNQDLAVAVANALAAEHVEIMVKNPKTLAARIENAGAIFLGRYTPEAVGDYVAGPSHVLPTGGTARAFSPLSIESFFKKTSIIAYDQKTFKAEAEDIMAVARLEGLEAHAQSVDVRL